MKILVACDRIVLAGGLIRFDRIARTIGPDGHRLSFVALGSPNRDRQTDVPVLDLTEAEAQHWDTVMIPGAGFPLEIIARLMYFRNPRFGIRVQHILNDQTRRDAFLAVNTAFAPHIIIFNNEHWPTGSFTEFKADRFHVLIGAVDTRRFQLGTNPKASPDRWVVGGLANKNPIPLVDVASRTEGVILKLFGRDTYNLAARFPHLIDEGRLVLVGALKEEQLLDFYHSVDCVAMTERSAGWANLVAEAMASGAPVICTPNGTKAIARDGETALVIKEPTAEAFANSLDRLRADPVLRAKLVTNARALIEKFDWKSYSASLLDICQHDGRAHYFYAPDLGLFGKWALEERLGGLQPLLERAHDLTVLDVGAAEGLIARAFLDAGAALVHGFDINVWRICEARRLTARYSNAAVFEVGDLSSWSRFKTAQQAMLKDKYDVVLFLGIHHHLPTMTRAETLREAARLARRYFAYRAPDKLHTEERVDDVLAGLGFRVISSTDTARHLSGCRIYERVAQ